MGRWSPELAQVTQEGWLRSLGRAGRSVVGHCAKETALLPLESKCSYRRSYLLPVGWFSHLGCLQYLNLLMSVPGHVVVVLMSVLVWVLTPEQKLAAMGRNYHNFILSYLHWAVAHYGNII